ncbi:alkylation response protein AidB-like acyl-CoA dehydrogenase [Rhodococcus sp. OK519]|uniref:acyl-CoA dehydrogenase family protein n=1 Tax=Rhodococcus sp. OK519 TaxID=2135729 RepID=UPI000D36143D|nr:alkylation response protein AidB-like acyl-CoA dehydrogenase [Rhodococcus sp. OK519]
MTATITTTKTQEREQARAFVRDRATLLDRGETDIRKDVSLLGSLGLIDLGLGGSPLTGMVAVIEDVAAESLSAGFAVWAHRMCLEYVSRGPAAVRDRYRDRLASGTTIGVTAMAAGLRHAAGLGEVPLIATPVDGGIEVSGPIRWASNVFENAVIVIPARSEDGATYVAVIDAASSGVCINPAPELLALGATASTSLTLDRVFVPETQIISTDLTRFCRDIRPTFLALQTSFCSGIAGTSLAESEGLLTGLGEEFADERAALSDEYRSLRNRLHDFATRIGEVPVRELIQLRLDGSHVAVSATRLEATLRGGAGYAAHHPTNRRFREAAFLPIQSPSEGQLRWELSQSR